MTLRILALSAFVAIIALVVGAYYVYENRPRERVLAAIRFSPDKLRDYGKSHGSRDLVKYVISTSAEYSVFNQHQIGHALGQVLYEREGFAAISLCGDSFTYGCLHSIVGLSYDEEGPGSVDSILNSCSENTGIPKKDCLHAVGHALVYVHGYRKDALTDILNRCDRAQIGTPFDYEDSCYGGAFMEYNMHFMSDNEGAYGVGRMFDDATSREPCAAITGEDRVATCSFWLLPWYHGQLKGHEWRFNEKAFGLLGDFCYSMDKKNQAACLMAVGREAAANTLPIRLIVSYCGAAARDSLGFDTCILGAVRILNSKHSEMVTPLCEAVAKERHSACLAFAESPESTWEPFK